MNAAAVADRREFESLFQRDVLLGSSINCLTTGQSVEMSTSDRQYTNEMLFQVDAISNQEMQLLIKCSSVWYPHSLLPEKMRRTN